MSDSQCGVAMTITDLEPRELQDALLKLQEVLDRRETPKYVVNTLSQKYTLLGTTENWNLFVI